MGVNKYAYVRPLSHCDNDVVEIAKAFRDILGFPDENILMFAEGSLNKPEREAFFHKMGELKDSKRITPDDLLIFYFSGHGIRNADDADYLLPQMATPYNLKLTGLRVEDVVYELKGTGCNNLVMFIDACRELVGGERGIGPSIGEYSRDVLSRNGIVTFFSCDPKAFSYEIDDLKHGCFTYCVLEAIRKGECNTVEQLYQYLLESVPLTNKKFQKPAQQPFAIIEPAEKAKLPIFLSNILRAKEAESYDDVVEFLGRAYAEQELDGVTYQAAVDIIELGGTDSSDEPKLRIIRDYYKGIIQAKYFVIAWKSFERLRVSGPTIRNKMGPLG